MLRREVPRFLLVGSTTVLVDLAVYQALLWFGAPVDPAKAASFVAGALFAYAANRAYTFRAGHSAATFLRFWAVYLFNLVVNVAVNALMLWLLSGIAARIILAFGIATALSAALNFLGMKHFVFVRRGAAGAGP
jgi:putative flippase GtrA